jgi:hypothetical protein
MPARGFLFALLLTQALVPLALLAQDLPDGGMVRIQSAELRPGWHVAMVHVTKDGCTTLFRSMPDVPGGRIGLGMGSVERLELRDGDNWIEIPLEPIKKKQPKHCHHEKDR